MKSIWIGLVNVVPLGDNSVLTSGAKGAFVNALALVIDHYEYESAVQAALSDLHLYAIEFEDVEQFNYRLATRAISDDLRVLAAQINDRQIVGFDIFHNYFTED